MTSNDVIDLRSEFADDQEPADHAGAKRLAAGLAALGLTLAPRQGHVVEVEIASEDLPALRLYLSEQGLRVDLATRSRLWVDPQLPAAQIDAALAAFGRYYAVKQHAQATYALATRPAGSATASAVPPGLAELYGSLR